MADGELKMRTNQTKRLRNPQATPVATASAMSPDFRALVQLLAEVRLRVIREAAVQQPPKQQ